jgi:putative membrane-bound dehydrogenase-like protein
MVRFGKLLVTAFAFAVFACSENSNRNKDISEVAGNDDVLNFMKTFEGRGDLTDSSHAVTATEAVKQFKIPSDLALDLVLSEPKVTQPVFITFDPQGRLWVVQYNQYPYPEGLKVLSMDQHTRAKFDKEPLPPPSNEKGADKITVFEDTDQDGTFDKSTDVITGLNLITSVAFGRGQIWVLNPPYLLAYPDKDNDAMPDGPPVVHLKGFGIEDTHAVANNLRFGPDGWLYGAQGSTCIANISSEVSKNVSFNGQAIWRYNPKTKVFEIFAEGGGNTFDVEIDEKGRLYSGDNGNSRGQYYKQGAYFIRNLGKHGAYTNPYTFGHLANMVLQGDETRFTHAFVRYEGNSLPQRYNDHMIAINPLNSYVQLTKFEQNGSTFKTIDEEKIMSTKDRWFRPVDITIGPDGDIYIADWYDSRISHIDPRDTWDKNSGRIYRLRSGNGNRQTATGNRQSDVKFNLYNKSDKELIDLLSNENIWFRQQALQVLGDRKNSSLLPGLLKMLQGTDGQQSLEALWAINITGGFNDDVAKIALMHNDAYVRMWGVRLAGDGNVSQVIAEELSKISHSEKHPEVRSQLAATAKRLHDSTSLKIIKGLLNYDDSSDPDIPLQLWWAIESVAESHRDEVINMFRNKKIWSNPTVSKTILSRLVQRYIIAGGEANDASCAKLFKLAPSGNYAAILFSGLQEGLRGRDMAELSPSLSDALKPYKKLFREQSLALDLRAGKKEAVKKALEIVGDENAKLPERLSYIRIFSEINQPEAVPVLLQLVETTSSSSAIKQAALLALQNYDNAEIGTRVVSAYPDKLRDDYDVRESAMALLSSRPEWAGQLLNAIAKTRTIEASDVPEHTVWQLKLLNDKNIALQTQKLWPDIRQATAEEKNKTIANVKKTMQSGTGDLQFGHALFIAKCGTCHKLFNEGRSIAPDLTGYDRRNLNDLLNNIVDPSAYIREGYSSWRVLTVDGRTVIGTLKAKNDKSLTIQPFTGEAVTISTSRVKSLEPMEASIMPERLLEGLSEKQVKDLFSYLMKE